MTQNMTLTTTTTDTRDLDALVHRAPATDDLLQLADWLHANGPAHLSAIERIELAERLITRRRFLIGAGALGLGVITGCGAEEQASAPTATSASAGYPRTIEHADGEMRLEEVPTRVISADGLRILDYLLSIGVTPLAASTGVGDTFAIALLDRTEQVEKIGSSGDLNIERMASLHPDFIVGFEWNYGDGLDELKQIAPCFVLDGESSPEWEANTRLIARCFAREEEADAAIQAVYERVASIGERIEEPVTISVIYPKADGSFFAMQPDYIIAELLAPAGITVTLPNGLDGEGGSLADVSPELLGDMPGEYLFVLPLPDAKNVIENNPLWETLDAVAAGRVLKGDASTWGNFSPIGLQALLDDVERALLS